MSKKFYLVSATKRSGHHAFIEWLYSGVESKKIYLNNCYPIDDDFFGYMKSVTNTSSESGFEKNRVSYGKELLDFKSVVLSTENKNIDKVRLFLVNKLESIKTDVDFKHVVFLRDPFNSLISLCKLIESKPEKEKQLESFVNCWISLSRCFTSSDNDTFPVFYNRFISDPEYRLVISKNLNINNTEFSTSLSKFGGGGNTMFGSSNNYVGLLDNVESRWKDFDNSALVKRYITEEFIEEAKTFTDHVGRPDLFDLPYSKFFS